MKASLSYNSNRGFLSWEKNAFPTKPGERVGFRIFDKETAFDLILDFKSAGNVIQDSGTRNSVYLPKTAFPTWLKQFSGLDIEFKDMGHKVYAASISGERLTLPRTVNRAPKASLPKTPNAIEDFRRRLAEAKDIINECKRAYPNEVSLTVKEDGTLGVLVMIEV